MSYFLIDSRTTYMPIRDTLFENGDVYHIFNKTIESKIIFTETFYSKLFLKILEYYRSSRASISYSSFRHLDEPQKALVNQELHLPSYFRVHILAYCMMPNHFHLLLQQKQDDGVKKFMSDSINSFTRYYNVRNQRRGPLFLPRFKSVLVRRDEQLMHVSRYIHLNPYSSHVVKNKKDLLKFSNSSLQFYIENKESELINTTLVMKLFGNRRENYERFILQNADYQEHLEHLKHTYNWR